VPLVILIIQSALTIGKAAAWPTAELVSFARAGEIALSCLTLQISRKLAVSICHLVEQNNPNISELLQLASLAVT
jgi:hypothetical protein